MKKVFYILGQLDDEQVEWLIQHGEKQFFAEGEPIIEQGKRVKALYILLDGEIRVITEGEETITLAERGAGEIFGEIAFIDERPHTATVEALTNCTVLAIPTEELNEKLIQDNGFAAQFYRAIAMFLTSRLRDMVARLGYGESDQVEYNENRDSDIISPTILDSAYMAGVRFEHILKRMLE